MWRLPKSASSFSVAVSLMYAVLFTFTRSRSRITISYFCTPDSQPPRLFTPTLPQKIMGARPMQVMCLVVQMREHQRAHSDVALPSTRRCWPGCSVRSCFVRLAGRCAEPKAYGWQVSFSRRELDNLPKSADFGERAACQDSQLIRPCRRILRSNLVTINSGFESGGPAKAMGPASRPRRQHRSLHHLGVPRAFPAICLSASRRSGSRCRSAASDIQHAP
jgi:hypothetical protein